MPPRNAICETPDVFDSLSTPSQRDTLNGDATFVFGTGRGEVLHINMQRPCQVGECILRVTVRFLEGEVNVRWEVPAGGAVVIAAYDN